MIEDLVKYIRFIADLLKEKGYEVQFYTQNSFHANYKGNYWKCIEVECVDNEIKIYSNICFYSRGKNKKESIEILSKMFDETQQDIDYVNSQLDDIYSQNNVIRMCQICGVPQEIIDKIKVSEEVEDDD